MATPKTVWGIDIGQVALKAIKLRNADGELKVEAFDIIEHPRILSQPDVDRRQLIRVALEQFLARNNVSNSVVAVAVPGQSSFTRFVKLPPVDTKKIPDIVRYEAEQQIPFPIADVVWRWQTFTDPDSPDIEVGIFAMKRNDVAEMLDRFAEVQTGVDIVQMAPLALYNFMNFDAQVAPGGATLLADVGADKTDLVVSDGPRIWTRTIQIGGNNFTEALEKAFKLSFSKAEKLKRTAATSKYARQIFQAMRPVFADLVQEVHRSIGFYTAIHRDTRFKRLIGLGNGFRLPGLQKYLEQNLNMPVVRIDSYNKITPSSNVSAPNFAENVLSLAVAYGLALQAMGQTKVVTNLLPGEIASKREMTRRRPWLVAAAVLLIASSYCAVYGKYGAISLLEQGTSKVEDGKRVQTKLAGEISKGSGSKVRIEDQNKKVAEKLDLFKYRQLWPTLQTMIFNEAMPRMATDQRLYDAYGSAGTKEAREAALTAVRAKPRNQRQVFFIEKMDVQYGDTNNWHVDSTAAPMGGPASQTQRPGFRILITGVTPLSEGDAVNAFHDRMNKAVTDFAANYKDMFEVAEFKVLPMQKLLDPTKVMAPVPAAMGPGVTPGLVPNGPRMPDPLIPQEDMSDDGRVTIGWIIRLKGNEAPQAPAAGGPGKSATPAPAAKASPKNRNDEYMQ